MWFKTVGGRLYTKMDLKPIRWRDYIKLTNDKVREEIALKNSLLRLTKEVDHHNSTNDKSPADSKGAENLSEGSDQLSRLSIDDFVKFSGFHFLRFTMNVFMIYWLLYQMTEKKGHFALLKTSRDILT